MTRKEELISRMLKAYKEGRTSLPDARKAIIQLISAPMKKHEMEDELRMCQFSGGADGKAVRVCSYSDSGPMPCHKCRVAAEWEECYG